MKIRKFFSDLNFKNKLILVFSVIIITSILFIGFFNYYETSLIIHKDIEKFSNKNLREVNLILERCFDQYEQTFFAIVSSPDYTRWIIAKKGDELNIGLSYMNIHEKVLMPVKLLTPEVITVSMLNDNGNTSTFFLRYGMGFAYDYSIQDESWIKSTKLNETNIISGKTGIYMMDNRPTEIYVIRLAKKFYFNANASGYIVIDVSMEPIKEILEEMKYADTGEGMILNQSGKIMAHTDYDKITEYFDRDLFNNEIRDKESGYIFDKKQKKIIVFSTIKKLGWKSVAIVSYDSVAGGVARIWSFTLAVIICSVVLSVFLIVLISTSLTKRIKALRNSMKSLKSEGLGKKVDISGNDEISELAQAYNLMLDNLEKYIHDLTESKLLQQQAVLSALQAQINSHFLYNTLEFINSMAYIAGQKEIRKTVVSLAKMLRYTSNYRETLVTIEDEITHLQDYLNILKLQMGDRLYYDIDVEENCRDMLCLKAIIQPIVENSIKHGLELKDTKGHIALKVASSGEYITIAVYDDGRGFSEDKLAAVREQLKAAENKSTIREIYKVGLVNVNYRLKVFYNNDPKTGVWVENLKNNGAQVILTFPLKRKSSGKMSIGKLEKVL